MYQHWTLFPHKEHAVPVSTLRLPDTAHQGRHAVRYTDKDTIAKQSLESCSISHTLNDSQNRGDLSGRIQFDINDSTLDAFVFDF
jgi:hypothetical protein